MKKLAGETVIYGVSSIVGRFLNWWLVPFYSHLFLTAEYGVVTNLYSYMAFLLVILTYGMETGYFRFASDHPDKNLVYSGTLIALFSTSLSFVLLVYSFSGTISGWLGHSGNPEYIRWMAIILALDAVSALPFAKLRIESKAAKFAALKIVNIFTNIFFNIFFLVICPAVLKNNPDHILRLFYSENIGIGYIFISNLIASVVTFILLIPEMKTKLRFSTPLIKKMLWYSFPILIVGVAGVVNQNIDKILIPILVPMDKDPMGQLGIYGANYKLAVLMNMFIQAFSYAFEPFFFSQIKAEDNKRGYALVLKYFVICGLTIFLSIGLFVDLFGVFNIIGEDYQSGLTVVPIILLANLFLGVYYTLSLWYKLTDKTRYGAYFSLIGAAITLIFNIIFIPLFGYMASAVITLVCFFIMSALSYIIGQKHYPVNYPLKRIVMYIMLSVVLFMVSKISGIDWPGLKYLVNTLLLFVFIAIVYVLENKELRSLIRR